MPEDRSNIATGTGRIPTKKSKPKGKSGGSSTKGKYDWGDGNGKIHTIPKSQHRTNVAARQNYGLGPDTPLDAPLTAQQAWGIAQAAAGQEYDPQIQAAQQLQTNAPTWYQNYLNESRASQASARTYAQPTVDTARTAVTNAAAVTPGLDPSSPQYAKELEAGKGRAAITQLGADTLAAIPIATDAYFAGQQSTAARELPQVLAGYGTQIGQLQGQRGRAVNSAYGQVRTGEQNAAIARGSLNLNTAKSQADIDLERGIDPVTGKALPTPAPTGYAAGGPGQNKYGYTYDEWTGMSDAAKKKERAAYGKSPSTGKTPEQKEADKKKAAEEKRIAGIRKASGSFKTKVRDAKTEWDRLARMTNPATDAAGDVIPGKFVKATPDQIKQQLRAAKYTETEIHVMLMLRGGKPLTQSEIDQIKQQNPDIRIPREWLKKGKPVTSRPGNAPGANGQQRPT